MSYKSYITAARRAAFTRGLIGGGGGAFSLQLQVTLTYVNTTFTC